MTSGTGTDPGTISMTFQAGGYSEESFTVNSDTEQDTITFYVSITNVSNLTSSTSRALISEFQDISFGYPLAAFAGTDHPQTAMVSESSKEDVFYNASTSTTNGGFLYVDVDDYVTQVRVRKENTGDYMTLPYTDTTEGRRYHTNSSNTFTVPTGTGTFKLQFEITRDTGTTTHLSGDVTVDNTVPSLAHTSFTYPTGQSAVRNTSPDNAFSWTINPTNSDRLLASGTGFVVEDDYDSINNTAITGSTSIDIIAQSTSGEQNLTGNDTVNLSATPFRIANGYTGAVLDGYAAVDTTNPSFTIKVDYLQNGTFYTPNSTGSGVTRGIHDIQIISDDVIDDPGSGITASISGAGSATIGPT